MSRCPRFPPSIVRASPKPPPASEYDFFLVTASGINVDSLEITQDHAANVDKLRELVLTSAAPAHWLWVEKRGQYITVWDAEHVPDWNGYTRDAYRFVVLWFNLFTAAHVAHNTPATQGDISQNSNCRPVVNVDQSQDGIPLSLGMITSVVRGGISSHMSLWPPDNIYVELYAFLHDDACNILNKYLSPSLLSIGFEGCRQYLAVCIDNMFRKVRISRHRPWIKHSDRLSYPAHLPRPSVRDWLAQHVADDNSRAMIVHKLLEIIKANGKSIKAICTFMPGLTAIGQSRNNSVSALQFILRMARDLNKASELCSIDSIVVVGGSILDTIRILDRDRLVSPEQYPSKIISFASRITKQEAQRRMLDSLSEVVSVVGDGPRIAIELESGLLSSVGTFDDLRSLASQINGHPHLDGRVGFNCDVAHWCISGIQPDGARDTSVMSRVYHAHISDTGKGHLSDLAPGSILSISSTRKWLSYIHDAFQMSGGNCGTSLELEYTACPENVSHAVSFLHSAGLVISS